MSEADQYSDIKARPTTLEDSVRDLKERLLPKLLVQTTQQIESRVILLERLGLSPGWLPQTRGWAASPDFLLLLVDLLEAERPRLVVECGPGVTTLVTAHLLKNQGAAGRVSSLEEEAYHAAIVRKQLEDRGLGDAVTITEAPLTEHVAGTETLIWYGIDDGLIDGPIDLLVIDGPRTYGRDPMGRYPAGPLLFHRLRPGAVILLDDADRVGERETVARWLDRFPGMTIERAALEKGAAILRWPG